MQLDKLLQSQGFGTRKQCQILIHRGHIRVDGTVIRDHKFRCNTPNFEFSVDGDEFQYREKVYIALNKPQGYECSHQTQHHHSVFELLPEYLILRNVQSIGRLDQDTTGLLLLTDDGQYLHRLTHPKKHVLKYYQIHTAEPLTDEAIAKLQHGVTLRNEQGIFQALNFEEIGEKHYRFAIAQGVYHQVKRMLAAVGNHVEALHRDQIGELGLADSDSDEANLDGLKRDGLNGLKLGLGEWCYLNEAEYHAATIQATAMKENTTS